MNETKECNGFEDISTCDLDFNNSEQAKEIIRRFTIEYLNGSIENLKDFSFWHIAGNPNYDGTCTPNTLRFFDGDHTRLAYAIAKLIYDEHIPDFILGEKYTGDTINSFRTLFGNRFSLRQNYEIIIENKFQFTETEKQTRNEFFLKYQTIGNFYVSPNELLIYDNSHTNKIKKFSINTYRGTKSNWKDYFDVYLGKLEKCLESREEFEDEYFLKKLLHAGVNKEFFFDYCKGNIEKFYKVFYLDGYSSKLFRHEQNYYYGHYKYKGDIKFYKEFAFDYVDKATTLIEQRSKKIVKILENKMGDKHE